MKIMESDASDTADDILDIEGLALAPGFIDSHSHADVKIFADPFSEANLRQGVTTEVTGNCGFSAFPVPQDKEKLSLCSQLIASFDFDLFGSGITWTDFSSYIRTVGEDGFSTNLLPLVGHRALRTTVMGGSQRKPTEDEMEKCDYYCKSLYCKGLEECLVG